MRLVRVAHDYGPPGWFGHPLVLSYRVNMPELPRSGIQTYHYQVMVILSCKGIGSTSASKKQRRPPRKVLEASSPAPGLEVDRSRSAYGSLVRLFIKEGGPWM